MSITFQMDIIQNEEIFFVFHYITSQLDNFYEEIEIKSVSKFSKYLSNKEIAEDEVFGDKTFKEWEEEAEIAYRLENEILDKMKKDNVFFRHNQLIYDKKKHTLLKQTCYFEDGEEKIKYNLIRVNDENITNPLTSMKYILNLEIQYFNNSIHIVDLIPFAYSTFDYKWVNINSIEMVEQYKTHLHKDILLKNTEKFGFNDDEKQSIFNYYVERNMFAETTKGLKEKIQKVFDI